MATTRDSAAEMQASERVKRLRDKAFTAMPQVCVERGYWWTESYKETESEPSVMRRAKALAKVLKNMTIHIEDDELIVGRGTTKLRGGLLLPEIGVEWLLTEMDTLSLREWDRFAPLTADEKAKISEFISYWSGKTLCEKRQALLPEDTPEIYPKIVSFPGWGRGYFAHLAPDYMIVLTQGLNGVKKRIDEEIEKLDLAQLEDFKKYQFLKAVIIALEAVAGFAKRYAGLARDMAKKEANPQRKDELEKIASTCEWVPANPARNLYEALQSIWFTYVGLSVEGWGGGIAFGRADQYLYPFYEKDMQEGEITEEEARELLALFYLKMNSMVPVNSGASAREGVAGGFPNWPSITLGGITTEREDAVNELSYLFLDAEKCVALPAEEIIIRINKITTDAFLLRACEVAKLLRGKLKFVSDETIIPQFLSEGVPVELARDYIITGCQFAAIGGYTFGYPRAWADLNLAMMLELALNNGISRLTGEQIGTKTGDPRTFKSYEEVWDAYRKQIEALFPIAMLPRSADSQVTGELAQFPFHSALFHGCIERGLDLANGGTPYPTLGAMGGGGVVNVGDSLAAIKKAVFEDKKITMGRLIDALDKNFEEDDEVWHTLKNCPKFGNDDDYVDKIVVEALVPSYEMVTKYHGCIGPGLGPGNVSAGYMVGALPDGRRAGEPLAEGGVSPGQGRNVSGPTATMRSAAKFDLVKMRGGSILNMKFDPEALKDEAKMRKFASLIRTYCETGGYLVQFNIIGADTLRQAQKNPEKYRDLLVRVSTYSARFVELNPDVQNDIIARTEFQEV